MNALQAWQLLLVAVAGWINRHQQDVIAYLQEENGVLKSKLKGKRIRFTDDERRRLCAGPPARKPSGPGINLRRARVPGDPDRTQPKWRELAHKSAECRGAQHGGKHRKKSGK